VKKKAAGSGRPEKSCQVSTLRQTLEKRNPSRVPIDQFRYDPVTQEFIYRPTGQVWKRGGVDAVVGRVEGMRATEWLKRYGACVK